MEQKGEKATDASSIRPVSSLRSHFEGLKAIQSSADSSQPVKDVPKSSSPGPRLDAPSIAGSGRVSLDLPRRDQDWRISADLLNSTIDGPKDVPTRAESPSKSPHKKSLSMLVQSSPVLPPTVQIESPRSPPKGCFFRNNSRSSERERTSISSGKVQELILQHTSSSPSRSSTPAAAKSEDTEKVEAKKNVPIKIEPIGSASKKPPGPPPPVNRADKPRIVSKPISLTAQNLASLIPENQKVNMEKKVSPFSTPPSSDGSPSPDFQPESFTSGATTTDLMANPHGQRGRPRPNLDDLSSQPTVRPNDPRLMGLAYPTAPNERRDARPMGFGGSDILSSNRNDSNVPMRANTTVERPSSRDTRNAGSGTKRHVSDTVNPSFSARESHLASATPEPHRDPRLFGLNVRTQTQNLDITDETRAPQLPRRHEVIAPAMPEREIMPQKLAAGQKSPARPDSAAKPTRPNTSGALAVPQAPSVQYPPPLMRSSAYANDKPGSIPERTTPPNAGGPIAKNADDSDEAEGEIEEPSNTRTEYPDSTQTNRRPPSVKSGVKEIPLRSDTRAYDVCGQYVCVSGYATRLWDLTTGNKVLEVNHGETVKVLSVAFKPTPERQSEGSRIWIGNNIGELHEIDVATQSQITSNSSHNRQEVVRILRHKKDLWSLDNEGKLFVWRADESGTPSLRYSHQAHRVSRGHTFSTVVRDELWLASGKEVRVYKPGDDSTFNVTQRALFQPNTGDVTSGTYTRHNGGRVYLGHTDGIVTIYSVNDHHCLGTVKASDYKITGLVFVGNLLWTAYKTGKIYVYDTSTSPWKVRKDWKAHDGPATGILLDPSSVWTVGQLQVVSFGHDTSMKLWDGLLEDDWLETAIQQRDVEYCSFREVKASVITWNAGACNPFDLRSDFISDVMGAEDPPELVVFGFQEVVDLEDRAVTARSLLGLRKKKDPDKTEQHVSRVYREWRDYLARYINRHVGAQHSYSELHTSSMIGLFQCVFVLQSERANIRNVCATDVKCGMKGHYGNKGALITRFVLDDCSLCFVNCHLAAGQKQTSHRNNDIAAIIESESLLTEQDPDSRMSWYIGGGDGGQILDHEVCILNGDLNYRIDAIPRDAVIGMIKRNEFTKLLERDQMMVSRRRVTGFRLSSFVEAPITFAPTYKYDVGTDEYDSSEKKRSPAWCDRILYRGAGRVKQLDYRRHEVRASDHRPVSASFVIRVKTIDQKKWDRVKQKCQALFTAVGRRLIADASIDYLVDSLGLSEREARARIEEG